MLREEENEKKRPKCDLLRKESILREGAKKACRPTYAKNLKKQPLNRKGKPVNEAQASLEKKTDYHLGDGHSAYMLRGRRTELKKESPALLISRNLRILPDTRLCL